MLATIKKRLSITLVLQVASLSFLIAVAGLSASAAAQSSSPQHTTPNRLLTSSRIMAVTPCGSAASNTQYTPSIDIGCKGQGNAIADATFAIIRVLSDGVGLVVIGSIVVGGIQYSASRGDPQSTAIAVKRLRAALTALLIYIFGYAILNFIIPGGFLH